MNDTPPEETAGDATAGHVVLGGRYVLGEVLGTGGTYTVYEATTVDDDAEPLVIKVLHPHLVDDAVTRAALAREIAASAQIDHPAVVKVLATGEDEVAGANVPWVVTRRLPGVLLADLTDGVGLPWPKALAVVDGLLTAVGAVHAAGLVHRDVSPRNVVVDTRDDGTVDVGLLDLGLTAPGGGDGDGDLVAGSVACMSPEQAQGMPLDARSDLYSVGALAYVALTGHAPYERARPDDVLRAHVGAPVPAPSARRAAVPVAVDRFVVRAMAKNPARRFASADEMAAAVVALLGAGPLATTASPEAEGADGPDGEQTMTLGQIAADDPDRTAVVGAAAAAAAAAVLADDTGLGRTRQLGAVEAAALADDADIEPGSPGPAPEPTAVEAEPEPKQGFFASRLNVVLLVLILVAATVGAVAWWSMQDSDDPAPVAPVTQSPSATPSPTRSTATPSSEPTDEWTSRPRETREPTRTPSATPSAEPTETPSATPTEEPTEEPTDEPTQEPTEQPTEEPTTEPTEEPTDEPTEEPTEQPTEEPTTEPTEEAEGGADPTQTAPPAEAGTA